MNGLNSFIQASSRLKEAVQFGIWNGHACSACSLPQPCQAHFVSLPLHLMFQTWKTPHSICSSS